MLGTCRTPLTQNRWDLWFGRGWYYTPLKNWLLRVYLVFREYLFFVNGTNVSFTVNDEVQFYADEKQCRRPSMDLQMQKFFYQTLLTWKYTNIHIINTFLCIMYLYILLFDSKETTFEFGHFRTISDNFFANYIIIFHKN